jgi:hypothetical protein
MSDQLVVEKLAETFAAAWCHLKGLESLVYDDFDEYLIRPLVGSTLSDEVWNFLKKRFDAREYPWGVLTFPPQVFLRSQEALKKYEDEGSSLVELFERRIRKLA